jgi:hypothetical protein
MTCGAFAGTAEGRRDGIGETIANKAEAPERRTLRDRRSFLPDHALGWAFGHKPAISEISWLRGPSPLAPARTITAFSAERRKPSVIVLALATPRSRRRAGPQPLLQTTPVKRSKTMQKISSPNLDTYTRVNDCLGNNLPWGLHHSAPVGTKRTTRPVGLGDAITGLPQKMEAPCLEVSRGQKTTGHPACTFAGR